MNAMVSSSLCLDVRQERFPEERSASELLRWNGLNLDTQQALEK